MYRLFVISLIFLLGFLGARGQNGRYMIDRVDKKKGHGFVTINPYNIILLQDSTVITLPIARVLEERGRTYFFLEGCYNNTGFQGAAILFISEYRRRGIYNAILYIELRTRQAYSFTRFALYYYE